MPMCTPFANTPPCAPIPRRESKLRHTASNLRLALQFQQPLRNRKQRGSGIRIESPHGVAGSSPITAPSPAPPRSALPARRRHLSPRRKGLSAGIAGTYRCGAGDEGRARQAGSGGRLPDAGAARSAVSRAGSRSSSRAGTRGALLRRLLPAPTPGARAPPAPSDRTSLPHATRPRLFPHRVSAAAGAARGPRSCSHCCPTEPSPRRRRRHSPIVRMQYKLHMLASDRRSAPGPV